MVITWLSVYTGHLAVRSYTNYWFGVIQTIGMLCKIAFLSKNILETTSG